MSSDAGQEVIVDVHDVGKCYQVYSKPIHRLMQGIAGDRRRYYEEFWALRSVNLSIRRGETLGIIGRNGSGKSTLLQLIAGTLAPTVGEIRTLGKVAALLELGSGFNPEFTGRENVYMNAAILGLTKTQIDQRFGDIEAFADIGSFIDQPVKNYSSGMMMRLAFSVMAHVDADVLIIDEALAVGDAFFTQKCMRYLRSFKERGTLLFVSHDDAAVTGLCDKVIWLENGGIRAAGEAKGVVSAYLESVISDRQGGISHDSVSLLERPEQRERQDARMAFINASTLRNDLEIIPFDPANGFGSMKAILGDVRLCTPEGAELAWVIGGDEVLLIVEATVLEETDSLIAGFYIKDRLGQLLFGDNTYVTTFSHRVATQPGEKYRATFRFQMPRMQQGDYFVTVGLSSGTQQEHVVQHWVHEALKIKVQDSSLPAGIIGIPMADIRLEKYE